MCLENSYNSADTLSESVVSLYLYTLTIYASFAKVASLKFFSYTVYGYGIVRYGGIPNSIHNKPYYPMSITYITYVI